MFKVCNGSIKKFWCQSLTRFKTDEKSLSRLWIQKQKMQARGKKQRKKGWSSNLIHPLTKNQGQAETLNTQEPQARTQEQPSTTRSRTYIEHTQETRQQKNMTYQRHSRPVRRPWCGQLLRTENILGIILQFVIRTEKQVTEFDSFGQQRAAEAWLALTAHHWTFSVLGLTLRSHSSPHDDSGNDEWRIQVKE